jgi:hypothetical protein
MVHATFQDANGYVEGLTAEVVDEFINSYRRYKHSDTSNSNHQSELKSNLISISFLIQSSGLSKEYAQKVKETWNKTQQLMQKLLELEVFRDVDEGVRGTLGGCVSVLMYCSGAATD